MARQLLSQSTRFTIQTPDDSTFTQRVTLNNIADGVTDETLGRLSNAIAALTPNGSPSEVRLTQVYTVN